MNDIYTFTVPIFIKTLGGLRTVLQRAEAHAKEKGIDEKTLLADQLISDMFPLTRQVQVACDNARKGSARLAGMDAGKVEDNEQTFAELIARIDSTVAYLKTLSETSFRDAAERQITLPYFPGKYLTGFEYARAYLIPNFFFHVVAAYAIVRKSGVPIGKADYTNGLPLIDAAV